MVRPVSGADVAGMTYDAPPSSSSRRGRASARLRDPRSDVRAALPPPLPPCLMPTTRTGSNLSATRSEEHTSELQSLMRISYAVFCLKKKKKQNTKQTKQTN